MVSLVNTSRYTIGILALLSVVCIWVSSSFLMNNIFADRQYNKPFFLTYINTASFSFYLLGPLLRQCRQGFRTRQLKPIAHDRKPRSQYGSVDDHDAEASLHPYPASTPMSPRSSSAGTATSSLTGSEGGKTMTDAGSIRSAHSSGLAGLGSNNSLIESTPTAPSSSSLTKDDTPLTHREIARLSFAFCILWFAANWATNASLAYTTVASSTILASMSGFFTLAIGAFLKTESFNSIKLIAVCLSVLGVALVSESDRGDQPGAAEPTAPLAPLFGDFLALMSAMFYGCYTVLLKVKIQNEDRLDMPLFFGFVGLFNLVLLWPMFGVLHWTGIEPFELPHDAQIMWMIVINAIVGTFVSDYLWLLSMLMTSPLVVTLGLSLTIPLALLGDVVGKGRVMEAGYWIGAALVLAGFFGVNGVTLSERKSEEAAEQLEQSKQQALEDARRLPTSELERTPLLATTASR